MNDRRAIRSVSAYLALRRARLGPLLCWSCCSARSPAAQPSGRRRSIWENPALVPVVDRDYVWDQIVDVVDNYFQIDKEERVRQVGDVLTVGRIDTAPEIGATLLEPWRSDSVNFYERLESTLQTIRRRALVQVVPAEGGFLVDVAVYKELENLQVRRRWPPRAAPSSATTRRPRISTTSRATPTPRARPRRRPHAPADPTRRSRRCWTPIPLGRDTALEQRIIGRIDGPLGRGRATRRSDAASAAVLMAVTAVLGTFDR